MNHGPIGISDIELYIPDSRMELGQILQKRSSENPAFERRLKKAIESTGQKAIRFPADWEDSATMSANATRSLLKRRLKQSGSLKGLRFLATGTETSLDLSKPLSAYVQGMLQKSGLALPPTLSSFQVQHACAGGTIALLSVASSLAVAGTSGEFGLISCSDIARYDTGSTAEITQGAGAATMLVEKNPDLLEIDLATQGYASADVDDFFRPLDSITAKVKGQYSMQCYNEAANHAFQDHCNRLGKPPAQVLADADYFVFHVPFAKMAYTAARSLLTQYLHILDGEVDEYLKPRGFFEALETTAQVGNIYTGAAYLNLASLLYNEWKAKGSAIIGKTILVSSYGSGNTMVVFSARIAANACKVIANWNIPGLIADYKDCNFDTYSEWISKDPKLGCSKPDHHDIPSGRFFLQSIRDDGYREYAYKS